MSVFEFKTREKTFLNEPIFQKCFEVAEFSHLSSEQYEQYQKSLIQYWDLKNVSDTSFEEGELSKAFKVAKEMLLDNEPIDKISRYTGLTIDEINTLKKRLNNKSSKEFDSILGFEKCERYFF